MSSVRQSILVVETDPLQREATSGLLQSAGFRVRCASGFDEAKRLMAADPPELLITAARLGEYNGLHLVLRTRAERPAVSAIVTSLFADNVLEAEVERHDAAFLVRPDGAQLLSAIENSLNSQVQ